MTTTTCLTVSPPLAPALPEPGAVTSRRAAAAARPDTFFPGASPAVARKVSSSKASSTSKASAAAKTSVPSDLSFLNNTKLSVQEKVFRLLLYLQQKYDKQVEAKLKEIAGKSTAAKSSSGSSGTKKKAKSGILGTVLKAAKLAMPAVGLSLELLKSPAGKKVLEQLSGPILGAACVALGMPQLAPLAAKLGPTLVDGLAAAQDLAEGEAPARQAATGASSSSSSSSSGETSAADEQRAATELQYLLEKQKAMTGLLSNCMRSMHETQMAVIGNIR